jgi:hypothetical protein
LWVEHRVFLTESLKHLRPICCRWRQQSEKKEKNMSRRKIAGFVAGLTVFGAVFASAASLGGITSGNVSAEDAVVASCDTDGVSTTYASSWDATDERYEVTSVTVSNISDNCDGRTISVSLTDSTGAQIGSGTNTVPGVLVTTVAVSMSTAASAEATVGVHVSIA